MDAPEENESLLGSRAERDRARTGGGAGGRGRGALWAVLALFALGALVVGGLFFFGDRLPSPFGGGAGDYAGEGNGTEVEFTVQSGDTGTAIGERLHEAGVVKTSRAFVDAVLAEDPEPVFVPGTYRLQEEMSAEAALAALLDESNRLASTFVVREGEAMQDVLPAIEAGIGTPIAELEAAAADPASYGLPAEATTLEGFLYPATYEFDPGTDARTILQAMVDRTFQELDAYGVPAERRWEVIRLASLVQREAGLREDYYKVSRVFLNRLEIGMNLESDATVAYGTGNTHRVETTDAERADAGNPYNTYVHGGLVAGPISNPGSIAIDAAMNPAEGQWLFFVTWNLDTGETIFSNTFEEHQAAVAKWQAWMEEHPEYQ